MTSGTKNTIWTIALVAVFLFLVWKLWPTLNAALASAGGGGGGSSGGSVTGGDEGEYPPDYYPYQQQQSPLQSLLSGLGNLFSGSGSGGGLSSFFTPTNLFSGSGATPASISLASEDTSSIFNAEDAGYGYGGDGSGLYNNFDPNAFEGDGETSGDGFDGGGVTNGSLYLGGDPYGDGYGTGDYGQGEDGGGDGGGD